MKEATDEKKKYELPPIDLLDMLPKSNKELDSDLRAKATKMENILKVFNADSSVVQVTQGPTVMRYEIQPATGVRISKIRTLADDIALNFGAISVRIEAPLPGKSTIGIEVVNKEPETVPLREILDSAEFKSKKSKVVFALGKDTSNNAVTADLMDMPHLLIGGCSGSGKTMFLNTLILSFLYRATPDEVKFMIIDPKSIEFRKYNGIPHLLVPVITDISKGVGALKWAVTEINERYNRFFSTNTHNVNSYNDLVRKNGENDKVLPQIVIVIDELSELMTEAYSQMLDSIVRIAQKGRAAGIHLVAATQRLSTDVITSIMKANIASRIAFKLFSGIDSLTIIDDKGAEKLIGWGDMLFSPIGRINPVRIKGCFVSDGEVNSVIEYIKSQVNGGEPDIKKTEIPSEIDSFEIPTFRKQDKGEKFLLGAIELAVACRKISRSQIQRVFRIGFNRAETIMNTMEGMGIVGPKNDSGSHEVIMTIEEFDIFYHLYKKGDITITI